VDIDGNGSIGPGDQGAALAAWGSGGELAGGAFSEVDNVVGYAGYLRDDAVGAYCVRFRWYEPKSGRWINRDPLTYIDGSNLYNYVMNMPSYYVDPLGLQACGVDGGSSGRNPSQNGFEDPCVSGGLGPGQTITVPISSRAENCKQVAECVRDTKIKAAEENRQVCSGMASGLDRIADKFDDALRPQALDQLVEDTLQWMREDFGGRLYTPIIDRTIRNNRSLRQAFRIHVRVRAIYGIYEAISILGRAGREHRDKNRLITEFGDEFRRQRDNYRQAADALQKFCDVDAARTKSDARKKFNQKRVYCRSL